MRHRGFTLIELVVVLTILALIVGIVLPNVVGHVGASRHKTARIQIEELGAALETFRLETGRYPNSKEGLEALVVQPNSLPRWYGPYLRKRSVPKDPWGVEYHYRSLDQDGVYELYTFGRDNIQGGEGEDADIKSWQ